MNENLEQIVIRKDPNFQFAEGTHAEIINQMPREIVDSLAEASLTNLSKSKVDSFLNKGIMVRLQEEENAKGNYRASFRTSPLHNKNNSFEIHPERVKTMEITPKEYTDQRIETLEKSIDHRFDSNEKLISEKLDHLHTKFEGTLETKLNALKDSISAEQKTQTQNNKTNLLTIIGIATAIIIGVISVGVTIAIAMLS